MGEDSPNEDEFRFQTVGEQLKAERERKSLTLADLAARTRVPMRHLEAIEKSDFAALPGTTYTLGFTRSYARALDMDAAKLSAELRAELAQGGYDGYQAPTQNYEPTDPARVPSRTLAWTAAAIGVLVVAAYLLWRSYSLDDAPVTAPQTTAPSVVATQQTPDAGTAPPVNQNAVVVLTATDSVWVKIYDAENKALFESEMKAGDTYKVPQNANKPMIVTGRPQALAVTVDGKAVPALGGADRTIVDVGVSAASLLARSGNTSANRGTTPLSPATLN
ncbi:MAG: RodZ domain-containing protein [Sphingorhabdus sp.]